MLIDTGPPAAEGTHRHARLTTELTFVKGATDPQLSVGEKIRMGRQASGSQAAVYAFADIDRKQPMLALTVVFIIVVLPLSHGISVRTGAALIGTLFGMLVAAVLSSLTVSGLHFTGTSSDEAATLKLLGSQSSVSGLLLCGVVIGHWASSTMSR
jgi:uncharacterized membrane protein